MVSNRPSISQHFRRAMPVTPSPSTGTTFGRYPAARVRLCRTVCRTLFQSHYFSTPSGLFWRRGWDSNPRDGPTYTSRHLFLRSDALLAKHSEETSRFKRRRMRGRTGCSSRHVIRRSTPMAPNLQPWPLRHSQCPSDEWRASYRRVSRPLVRLARSAILSMACCQPASASFMALSVASLLTGGGLAEGLGFPLLLNLTIWLAFLVTTSSLACAAVQLHPTGTAVPR